MAIMLCDRYICCIFAVCKVNLFNHNDLKVIVYSSCTEVTVLPMGLRMDGFMSQVRFMTILNC